jgi:hypothetical protein
MKAKLFLFLILLVVAPSAFGQVPNSDPTAQPCPDGWTRIYTKWDSPGHPTESGCVASTLVQPFRSDGSCPSQYWHTASAVPPHSDVCASLVATVLDRKTDALGSQDSASASIQTDQNSNAAPSGGGRTWAMFENMQWPAAALRLEIGKVCGLPFDEQLGPTTGSAIALDAVVSRLSRARESLGFNIPVVVAPVGQDIVNAYTFSNMGGKHVALICLPAGMRKITSDAPEELAAVLAHEMGHAVDSVCWNYRQRSLAGQRSCEARADTYGFAIFVRAGYNPFAFAGLFGRLEMDYGDTNTGILSRLANAIASNHPMTPDRIDHLRQMLVAELQGKSGQQGQGIPLPPAVP